MRILVVEDSQALADCAHLVLARALHACDLAGSKAVALTLLDLHTYQAVVADRGLPDGDGLAVMERARDLGVPRLVLATGAAIPPEEEAVLASRGVRVLAKPYTAAALLESVGHEAGPRGVR